MGDSIVWGRFRAPFDRFFAGISGGPPAADGAARGGARRDRCLDRSPAAALAEGECLLHYVAEAGVEVGEDVTKPILQAKKKGSDAWGDDDAAALLSALAKLSAKVHPVTAESLRACAHAQSNAMWSYRWFAYALLGVIVPLSAGTFVVKGISEALKADIAAADRLAVGFVQQIGPAPTPAAAVPGRQAVVAADCLVPDAAAPGWGGDPRPAAAPTAAPAPAPSAPELQEFAARIRAVHARAAQLDPLMAWARPASSPGDPLAGCAPDRRFAALQLPVPLSDPAGTAASKIATYQAVRAHGDTVRGDTDLLLGVIGSVLLPILYALLGACAYLLRDFALQVKARTFVPSHANAARILTAAIGGAVVALFPDFNAGAGPAASPLAVAFVVGYALDLFFSFLDNLFKAFRSPEAASGAAAVGNAKAGRPDARGAS